MTPEVSSFLSSMLGAIIGGVIAYFSGKRVVDYNELKSSNRDFRESFTSVLNLVEGDDTTHDTYNLLKPDFDKHKAAYLNFRFCIKRKDRHSLDDLWNSYCTNILGGEDLIEYADNGSLDKRRRLRRLARDRIIALINFK